METEFGLQQPRREEAESLTVTKPLKDPGQPVANLYTYIRIHTYIYTYTQPMHIYRCMYTCMYVYTYRNINIHVKCSDKLVVSKTTLLRGTYLCFSSYDSSPQAEPWNPSMDPEPGILISPISTIQERRHAFAQGSL